MVISKLLASHLFIQCSSTISYCQDGTSCSSRRQTFVWRPSLVMWCRNI